MSEIDNALIKLQELDKKYVELFDVIREIKGLTSYQEEDIWNCMQEIDINMGKLMIYLEELEK